MSVWRILSLGIMFILWVAFSFGINAYMTGEGYTYWLYTFIPLYLLWLAFAIIAYFVLREE